MLANPAWKNDVIPEIMDGRNIADFFDPEIEARLNTLEKEEAKHEADGFYTLTDEELVTLLFPRIKKSLSRSEKLKMMIYCIG